MAPTMKLKKIDLPQQPKTYQDGINLYSLINFKDFFAPLFATGDIKSVCEIGVEVGSFTQWLADQAKLTGFKYYGVDPQVGAATQKLCPELDFISKKSTDYLADHHVANHDVYFIDGDHNFYTVYNELQLIFSNPLQAQKICFLHDIGWPCGRRDWYYNINDIPAAARHEHTHDGRITLGESALSPFGFETCGRAALALHEGGANNGVLTAIEKFIETHADGRAITFIKIPIFYGLGILYDKNQISARAARYLQDLAKYAKENYNIFSQFELNRLSLYLRIITLQQQQVGANAEFDKKLAALTHEMDAAQITVADTVKSKQALEKIEKNSQRNRALDVLQKRHNSHCQYKRHYSVAIEHALNVLQLMYRRWRRRQHDHVLRNLKEIVAKTSAVDVVSFDVFDTLVHRKISPPAAVKDKTAHYASLFFARRGITVTPEDFNLVRDIEENKLRDKNLYYQGFDHETDINSIFDAVIKTLMGAHDGNVVENFVAFELTAEIAHLYLNCDAAETLSLLHGRNKKIILCSDMYLKEAHLWKICDHFNISQYVDKIYVSSEQRISKYSGRIFKLMMDDLNLLPHDLVHVGDNEHSDYHEARKAGITAYHFFYESNLRQAAKLEASIKKFNRGDSAFGRSCYSALRYFKLDSQQWRFCAVPEKIGVCYLAPAIATFAHRALLDMMQLGVKKVFFLAREGIFLQKVFTAVLHQVSELKMFADEIEFNILFISRVASIIGNYNGVHDVHSLIKPVYFAYPQFNFANFCKTWGLNADDFSAYAKQSMSAYMQSCTHEEFCHLLQDEQFATELDSKMAFKQKIFNDFLKQEGVAGEQAVALVDVGWNGTIQSYIANSLEKIACKNTLYGFYLGGSGNIKRVTHNRGNSIIFPGYLFNDVFPDEVDLFKLGIPMLEALLGDEQTSSVKGYAVSGNSIVPEFKGIEQCHFTIKLQQQVQSSVLNGVKHYCAAINISPLALDRLAIFYKKRLLSFVSNPKKSEINAFKGLSFDYDWGNNGIVPIVDAAPRRFFLHPCRSFHQALISAWPNAALKMLPIPFLCRLYTCYKRYSSHYPHLIMMLEIAIRLAKKAVSVPRKIFFKKSKAHH